MRNKFADAIFEIGSVNDKICALVADISPAGSMEKFRKKYPKRFINCGVAEQSMIGISAGLALKGMRPFCYTIATFALFRPFEFIRVDLGYQKYANNIKLIQHNSSQELSPMLSLVD